MTTRCEAKNRTSDHSDDLFHFFTITKPGGRQQIECLSHAAESERRGQVAELIRN